MLRINQLNQNLGIPESRSAEALLLGSLCILPENSLTLGKKTYINNGFMAADQTINSTE
jgi:hypothetical protein